MPKDTTIKRIIVIGSGPIVIGQGCEFDYSSVQGLQGPERSRRRVSGDQVSAAKQGAGVGVAGVSCVIKPNPFQ